jgi:small GTP-binding protein
LEYKDFKSKLWEEAKAEELKDSQLENLKNFLRDLEYTKEEFVSIFDPKTVLKEDDWVKIRSGIWEEFMSAFNIFSSELLKQKLSWEVIIHLLIQLFGWEEFTSQIAHDLHIKFDKSISQGQAEAVLKRVLDVNLTSTGRTQIYELRKKIRKYDKLISHFRDWVKIYDFSFKVLIMGLDHQQSFKLLPKPAYPELKDQRSALGMQFFLKSLDISDKKVQLQLWDISLEKKYKTLIQLATNNSYIYWISTDANGAIIVIDKSKRESLTLAEESFYEFKKATNLKFELNEKKDISIDIPIILVGLGSENKVTSEEGKSLAKRLGAYGYIEISDINKGVFENVYSLLSRGLIQNYKNALKRFTQENQFKVAVVGNTDSGKTSLIQRYTKGSFNEEYRKTIGAQFSYYDKELEGNHVRASFWDIAGGESYHFLHRQFIKKSKAAIIVYNLEENGQDKLTQISDWYDRIIRFAGDIPIIILGNKVDRVDETKLDISGIQDFVKKNNLLGYYLTSVKTGEGINEAFDDIIKELYNKYKTPRKFRFKITFVGDGGVGKTSLIMRYTRSPFKLDYVETIGAQFSVYEKEFEKDKVRALFWDIAGQDSFHFLRPNFFRNSEAVIIVYSLEDNNLGKESFEHISAWHDDIIRFAGNIPIFIWANKVDLTDESKLNDSEIQEFIKMKSVQGYYITSAKTGKGINEAFDTIIEHLYKKYKILPVE